MEVAEAISQGRVGTLLVQENAQVPGILQRGSGMVLPPDPTHPSDDVLDDLAEEVLKMEGDPTVIDAALIAAAQRVEHYEISGYGTVKTLAGHLDLGDAKDLLDETLDEEGKADKLLRTIATGGVFKTGINQEAKA